MSERTHVTNSRKELHGNVSPAVFTRHAREVLAPQIENLDFPSQPTTDPLKLAESRPVKEALAYSNSRAELAAKESGISEEVSGIWVFHHGFGDRHFVPLFAGGLGKTIDYRLLDEGLTHEQLSLKDYSRMFQTGWFGTIANQVALTRVGEIQPNIEEHNRLNLGAISSDIVGQPLEFVEEPESGLMVVSVNKQARSILRGMIPKDESVGCPVARTTFSAKPSQVEFLEEFGHLGESSGFVADEENLTAGGLMKVSQGAYTAIDDVLLAWGNYVDRYANSLLSQGITDSVEATDADKVLLLN